MFEAELVSGDRSIMRIATFNMQNLRLRTREGRQVLDGATDQDMLGIENSLALDLADRKQTARVITEAGADIVGLQEVFDPAALDFFHDEFLLRDGLPYPFRYCLPGNDGRGLNVGALSRRRPAKVVSHAVLTGADLGLWDLPSHLRDHRIFRRDCLELDFEAVSVFICHLKAPYPDAEKAHAIREAEARAVRKIIETRSSRPEQERWIILGDFNEPAKGQEPWASALAPLGNGFAVDLFDRLTPAASWTYEMPDSHLRSCPDRILLSPRLAREHPDARPHIIRSGLSAPTESLTLSRQPEAASRPHASDHALVYVDLPGI